VFIPAYPFGVFVVALASLSRSIDEEIPPLAADLGVTPYEAGLMLRAPMPIVVLRCEDRSRAQALFTRLHERGHDAVALDATQVPTNEKMTALRTFRFDDDALVSIAHTGAEERLGYGELTAVVRAMHTKTTEKLEKEKVLNISVGRAVMTGGLLATKTTERQHKARTEERDPVLYLFRRDGTPWILRASHARYDGLGADLRPTTLENVASFMRLLRARAMSAVIDERLLAVKNADNKAIDLLASVIAVSIARVHAYRGGT
jgi:hypothetical protein